MAFTVQRFHPLIRPGLHLGTASSKFPVHSGQSSWDSLCSLHSLAMALQIAGLVIDPSRIATRRRKIEVAIRRKAVQIFDKGMTFAEFAGFIAELDCGLHTKLLERGSHREATVFAERELARKRLVVCSFRMVGDSLCHAVVAIGVEAIERSGRIKAHALLILDPAEIAPGPMAACNARLDYADRESGEVPRYARYTTASETSSVVLNSAISIEVRQPLISRQEDSHD